MTNHEALEQFEDRLANEALTIPQYKQLTDELMRLLALADNRLAEVYKEEFKEADAA